MIEFKTLEDINEWDEQTITGFKEELQKSIIEDINKFNSGEYWTDFAADGRNGQENICEYLMKKFDITENDLK